MRRGSTAKPPSSDPPRPRSPAKTSGPWRKLAEMNGSKFDCFNEPVWPHQDGEGHLHDRASSSLDLMPPGPRDSWTEGNSSLPFCLLRGCPVGDRGLAGGPPHLKNEGGGGGWPARVVARPFSTQAVH